MRHARTRLALCLAALVACLCVAGCAGSGSGSDVPPPAGPGRARTPAGGWLTPEGALEALAVGTSTRADVAAALGKAIVIAFDSGHEVWLYRWPGKDGTAAATELVLLFDPSGRLAKLRRRGRRRPGVAFARPGASRLSSAPARPPAARRLRPRPRHSR